jgi:hypothetical protein
VKRIEKRQKSRKENKKKKCKAPSQKSIKSKDCCGRKIWEFLKRWFLIFHKKIKNRLFPTIFLQNLP